MSVKITANVVNVIGKADGKAHDNFNSDRNPVRWGLSQS